LELGSGFNPEFTGRENVYLNASMLGLGHAEINDRFDAIAAFADIGDFLEQPTKTYSSGMLMRLAFAVNTCIHPEILIVDEALGVGDAPFQSKCFKRLRQLIADGTSVLFVSHDISTVRSICAQALWLKNGRSEMWGAAKEVAREYERFCWQQQGVILQYSEASNENRLDPAGAGNGDGNPVADETSAPYPLFQPNPVFENNCSRSRIGTGDVVIKNFVIVNEAGQPVTSCEYNEKVTLYYLLELCSPISSDFILGIRFRDLKGNFIYSANDIHKTHRIEGNPGDRILLSADLRIPLTHQDYVVSTAVFGFQDGMAFSGGTYDYLRSVIWDVIEDAAYLKVHPCKIMPLVGPVHATFDLKVRKYKPHAEIRYN
jgi:lipopolysaccharide transport system ATP-binding protein